ncbi:hypothetical protein J40TS1_51250 [Paenibacillus montaniterrae]|uniref:SLH domain-containing protein n=1 Tax=Paenibacillus montaniterrae TaxID=429341 RepID=A0A919YSY3_9BACL|nr:Ig-like domain-containing protein [Paenibacillus montaniterrae]GIP19483.1 hypothetical protein J40TS1_51250 [Paenibacillus montaniterrae]
MKSMSTWMSNVAQNSMVCSEMRLARKLLITLLIFSMLLGSLVSATPVVQANDDDPIPAEAAGWVVVETAEQLAYINRHSANYVDRNIRLTNDIDMTGYEWVPFGDEAVPFSGVFDGRGHQIKGLTIDGGTLQFAGFFGRVTGTIQNLGVSVHVSGGTNLGGLVGYLHGGSIIQSYSQGTVIGGHSGYAGLSVAGGLVGVANGNSTIIRSYSTASVTSGEASNQYAGGLVGSKGAGTIQDSYATGAVSHSGSNNYVFAGGLAGQLVYGTISNSYAAGNVMSAEHNSRSIIGGFVGINTWSSIVASFFDNNSTAQSNGIGGENGISQLTGLSTTDMKLESSYGEEWDFTDTWAVHADVNTGYPYLLSNILTDELPRAIKDAPYTIKLEAFDGSGAGLSWSASGLPQGLEVTVDGVLQGTPVLGGVFTVTVSATDIGMKTISSVLTLYIDEYAPNIIGFAISPGNERGTTKVTADTGGQGHTFAYVLGSDAGERPLLGDSLPDTAALYTLGTDIAAVSPGQFLQVYELDHEQRIHAWSSIELAESHIQDQIRVTGVSLDKTELALVAGGPSQKLTATVEPGNATNQTVTWSSSDSRIAVVNLNGEVTPISEGTAIITVTTRDGAYTATATVTVHPAPPTVGTITGKVYGEGAKPLAGAKVLVGGGTAGDGMAGGVSVEGGEVETTTDAAGSFVLENIAEGNRLLSVTVAGYIEYKTTVNVVAGETTNIGRIELTTAPIAVTRVSLDKTELSLVVGGSSQKLIATIEPRNATNQTVTWSSSDSSIAEVGQNGEVTPISEGTAIITVTTRDGAYSATATVTVQSAPPTVGVITGTVYGEGDKPLAGAKVSVVIGSAGDVLVGGGEVETTTDAAGSFVIENIAEGSYSLTVSAAGYIEYKTTVNVVAGETTDIGRIELTTAPVAVTGVSLDKTELTLVVGGPSLELNVTVEPRNATNQAVTWSSSDMSIAEVDQQGKVTPISEGTAIITVTTHDGAHTATAMVTVQPAPPTVGVITGTVYGEGDRPLAGAKVSVVFGSAGDVSVGGGNVETTTDAAGSFVIENIAEGSYSLTVSAAGYIEYKTTVNVVAGEITDIGRIELTTAPIAVTGVSLDKTELTLVVGGSSQKLIATVEPRNATDQTVTWRSSDSSIAEVDQSGEVRPVSEGTATITVTTQEGAYSATATVTVHPAQPTVGVITGTVYGEGAKPLAGAKVSVGGGTSGDGMAGDGSADDVSAESGNVETTTDAAGSFVLENIAEGSYSLIVTAAGYIEYKTTVNVVAGESTVIGRIELTASTIAVTGVSLDKTELSLVVGGSSQKLIATVEPRNATNQAVTWSSSDSSIAEVDQSGEVTPISAGTATITVTTQDGAHTATATVTVQPAPPIVGIITGTVYGERNTPLAGAKVSVDGSSVDGGKVEVLTDSEGEFTLNNIAEGSYELTVTAPGYNEYTTTVNVIADKTTEVGRIVLQKVTPPGPSPGWNDPPASSQDRETMSIVINGNTVQVTAKKEQDHDGRSVLRLVMDDELIQSWFTSPEEIVIAIDNEEPIVKVDLPAVSLKALSEAQPDKLIRIAVNGASYSLPLHSLQHVPNSATITAAIATMPDSAVSELEAALNKQGYTMLVKPMSFYLLSNNKELDVQDIYMERIFSLDTEIQANRATVVKVEDNGRLQFVLSVFETGKAAFYTLQNGWFTAIATERAFTDTKGHWAQAEIELLASKLIVDGSATNTFNPERSITRAEFAALLVRALGLTEKPQHVSYSDIQSENAWYVGAIGAAAAAGLIEGFSDGTFRPNTFITREQMVVMLGRAIRFTGELPAATAENSQLESFTDYSELADWAKGDAEQLLAAGIIEGTEDAAFAPKEPATRAQSAVLLVRMLRYLDFINE